ncbi:hypothetical protein OHA46_24910 [Streptomyces sp. NBC_00708]
MSISTWNDFVTALRGEVDWRDGSYMERQASVVEEILRAAAARPEIFAERTDEILADGELFRSLAPHSAYPRILMDKFVLHSEPGNGFRIRLHRFKTRLQNGGAQERVHYHKWHCSTVMLRGGYRERQFEVLRTDEEASESLLREDLEHSLAEGESNSLPAGRPHQVINDSDTDPCLTLFVRGPSVLRAARIFDMERGTFYDTFDPDGQLKVGLAAMGRLDPDFH